MLYLPSASAHIRMIKSLLSTPEKWTRGTTARDKDGHYVAPDSSKAFCWCIVGAGIFFTSSDIKSNETGREWRRILNQESKRWSKWSSVIDLNDDEKNFSFERLHAFLDSAIEAAEDEENNVAI